MKSAARSKKAIRAGKLQAQNVLADRSAALRLRARAVKKGRATAIAAPGMPVAAAKLVAAAGGPASNGVLVAEGDSWFDYPGTDVLGALEDVHGYDVESVAHKGDRVEDMAYSDGQLEKFARAIERLLRRQIVPRAILLSGGGNDVAGDEFAVLLDHASSPTPGLNESVVTGVIDQRIAESYAHILSAVTEVCRSRLGRVIPIVVHGYDYPVPDGRGFLGGWGPLPGPWLDPGLCQKGYPREGAMPVRLRILRELMDRFHAMLARTVALPAFAHVRHVDLRGTLSTAHGSYKDDWANELHPSRKGFRLVAAEIAAAL